MHERCASVSRGDGDMSGEMASVYVFVGWLGALECRLPRSKQKRLCAFYLIEVGWSH